MFRYQTIFKKEGEDYILYGYEILALFPEDLITTIDDYLNFKKVLAQVERYRDYFENFRSFFKFYCEKPLFHFNIKLATLFQFTSSIFNTIAQSPIKNQIVLELIEEEDTSLKRADFETIITIIKAFKKENIAFALDDFGLRWSNFDRLSLLKDYIDIIKIDKALWQYAKTFNGLWEDLKEKIIIVEKIENQSQIENLSLKDLSLNGNVFVQGFYYHKPEVFQCK